MNQPKHPKYRISALLRDKYGELNLKEGIDELAQHCQLRNKRTVSEWLKIEAGSTSVINHFVLGKVLSFFQLQKESQLFTREHKNSLKPQPAENE